jgi:phage gp36-like protein
VSPYATATDLVDRFGESELIDLTDRAQPPAGMIDADVADKALADACGEADAYLGVRYTLPVTAPVPLVLVAVVCDIARYRLYENRSTEEVRKRYEDAVRWLRDVSRGAAVLPGAAAATGEAADLAMVVQPGRKVFRGDFS